MLSEIGRLPQPGDVVHTANLKLTVERVAARRVEFVRVELVGKVEKSKTRNSELGTRNSDLPAPPGGQEPVP